MLSSAAPFGRGKSDNSRPPRLRGLRIGVPIVAVLALTLAACSSSSPPKQSSKTNHNSTTTTTAPPSTGTTIPAAAGSKPAIPTTGSYLGSWVDASGKAAANEVQSGPATGNALSTAIAKPLGITNNFISWNQSLDLSTLQSESAAGTIPMVDWHCGALNTSVAAGSDDAVITKVAESLKSFGKPVFLRWYWEMNFTTDPQTAKQCLGTGGPAGFIAAWQHIWKIFQNVGATNVAFVWCPGGNNISTLAPQFYPGNQYVDWIAVDVYAVTQGSSFAKIVAPFYNQFSSDGKPLMIAETGAHQGVQSQYLQGVATSLPAQFPDIKAFLYFDGSGPRGDWSLDSNGLAAFKVLANSSYFSPT